MPSKYREYLKFILILTVIMLLPGILSDYSVRAQTSPYTLDALDINYNYQDDKIYAEGDVVFKSGDLLIRASTLVVDLTKEMAVGDDVTLESDKHQLKGKHLEYNYIEGTGSFYGAETRLDELKFKGKVINIVEGQEYLYQIDGAVFTPCILPEPHYQFHSASIFIYPGDRVVGKNIKFYWGNLPIFWLPYYVVEYQETKSGGKLVDATPIPHLGYNSKDGLTVEFDYPYELNENSKGKIYFNTNLKDGREVRLDNTYNIRQNLTLKSGYVYDKVISEEEDIEINEMFSSTLNYQINDQFSARGLVRYGRDEDDGITDITRLAGVDLNYRQAEVYLKTGLYYDFYKEQRQEEITLAYRPEIYNIKFYQKYLDEELDNQSYSLNNTTGAVRWNLTYRDGYDTDYLPYLKVKLPSYYNISSDLEAGRVGTDEITLDKARIKLAYTQPITINDNFSLKMSGGYTSNLYNWPVTESYQIYKTGIKGNYEQQLSDKIDLGGELSWASTTTSGNYLLEADEVDTKKEIGTGIELRFATPEPQSAWILANSNSYRLDTGEWEEVLLEVTRQKDCYSLSFGYDFIDKFFSFAINL